MKNEIALLLALLATPAFSSGWDYNLTKQCASTTGAPGQVNYYSIRNQCPAGPVGLPPPKYWQLGVQVENQEIPNSINGQACTGTNSRSEQINGQNSPVTLAWFPHSSNIGPNHTVNMKIDRSTYPPPASCAGTPNVWTWFAFQDNAGEGGGPLPSTTTAESSHVVNFSYYLPGPNDGVRLIASATFYWNNVPHTMEIDVTSVNYGYTQNDQGLLTKKTQANGAEYIVLHGPTVGVSIPAGPVGVDTLIYIPWNNMLELAFQRNWFVRPAANVPRATSTIGIAVEVRNRAVADLYHTDFRIGGQ